jgi:hypothetical protein
MIKMYCPRCEKKVIIWWGVCDICGYDITNPINNEIKEKLEKSKVKSKGE